MEEIKKWILEQIKNCKESHNESTYMWSKGYRKALLDVLNMIKIY